MNVRILEQHLEKLRGFVEIGESGSIHEAARRLGVTQPALSRMVKSLESALQTSLLHRGRHGIFLTSHGKILFEFAERILRESVDIEQRVRFADEAVAGKMLVGTYQSIAVSFWPKFLRRLRAHYPGLSVSLTTLDEAGQYERLGRGEIHLVVSVEPPADVSYFSTVLYRDSYGVFSSPHFRTGAQMSAVPLAYVPSAADRKGRTLQAALARFPLQPSHTFEVDNFETAKYFALECLGAAILPRRVAARELASGLLIPARVSGVPPEGFGEHRVCATMLSEAKREPRIRTLVRELSRHCSEKV